MKKTLFIFLVALLALAACDSNGDEPGNGKLPRILMEIYTGKQYLIYDNDGKLVYECPETYGIVNMAAEGKNWYGVMLSNYDSVYRVLKNGKPVLSTTNEIKNLCVENGNIYTLQWDKAPDFKYTEHYTARIFKNESQLYEYDSEEICIYDLSVDHGDLIAKAWYYGKYGKPTYWINGKMHTLPINKEYAPITHIVKNGKDTLAILRGESDTQLYWWMNGEIHQLPYEFGPDNSIVYAYPGQKIALVNGTSYVVGYHYRKGITMIVNGQEYQLEPNSTDIVTMVLKLQRYGNDVYTLTGNYPHVFPPNGNTTIFKGTEPIEINCKVYVPNVRYSGGGYTVTSQGGDTVNLAEFSIEDFAVLDR